ncbi:MAG: helix-turn-helix domain-containing protein [Prevotellaceae bacterium]|jgi:transcriptional regulator with XRE-family HTH domain|nr:helix-turn-helix domain-containing protein [Prevotellaceae bacterium]
MKIQKKFGIIIKTLRNEKGISQETLAFDADIDRTYISDIEKGNRNVSIEIIERLANYFHISVSELLKKVENYGK